MDESLDKAPKKGLEGKENFNIKILLADDDGGVRMVTAMILKMMGCTVEEVENGKQLLERLATAKPGEFDLIMTDIRMPEMDGIEALTQIRANEQFKQLPVIVYSGTLDDELKKTITSLGGLSLEKPFEIEKLKETVKKALSK